MVPRKQNKQMKQNAKPTETNMYGHLHYNKTEC
jgi:hypothetical protein